MRVGFKGQIVIPKIFRDEYNITPGDTICIQEEENKLVIEKPQDPISEFKLIAKKMHVKKKIDVHAVEEEYEERWKRAKLST